MSFRSQPDATGQEIATFQAGVLTGDDIQAVVPVAPDGTPLDVATAANQASILATMADLLAEMQQKTEPGQTQAVAGTVGTKTALTASGPQSATVGVASAEAVPVNSTRRGLVLVNTSENRISLAFGVAAELGKGITLDPGGSWTMGEYTFTTQQVRAIASAAGSSLAYQEFTA